MSSINSKTSPCLQSGLLVQCISAAACNNKAAASVSRVGTTLAKSKARQQVRPVIERYSYKASSFCEIHDFLSCMITSQSHQIGHSASVKRPPGSIGVLQRSLNEHVIVCITRCDQEQVTTAPKVKTYSAVCCTL